MSEARYRRVRELGSVDYSKERPAYIAPDTFMICMICGSAVIDTAAHDAWHEGQKTPYERTTSNSSIP